MLMKRITRVQRSMKLIKSLVLAVTLVSLAAGAPVLTDVQARSGGGGGGGGGGGKGGGGGGGKGGGHGGHHGHHGHRHGGFVGVGVGGAFWGPWYYPGYAWLESREPIYYIERGPGDAAADGAWFFCPVTGAYFPAVVACPGDWQRVPVVPPGELPQS